MTKGYTRSGQKPMKATAGKKAGKQVSLSAGLTGADSDNLVIVEDNTQQILQKMPKALARGLEAVGLAAEGYAKRLCPVDTGRLRNSITHTADSSPAVYIGTNVEYGPYVELGTSKRKAHPFLKPAAEEHKGEYEALFQREFKKEMGD